MTTQAELARLKAQALAAQAEAKAARQPPHKQH